MAGELEKTLFERMCMAQKLRSLVSSCEFMGHRLKPFADRLGSYLTPAIKGTLLEDLGPQQEVVGGKECRLDQSVVKNLQQHLHYRPILPNLKVMEHDKFVHRGFVFSPSSFSLRDSRVAINKGGCGDWYAGEIKQIFTIGASSNAYFVIQKFRELSAQRAQRDPYRRYPLVGGRLYHPEIEGEIDVVTSQEIISHFAHTPFDEEKFGFPCFHALPLNKVLLL